MIYSVKIFAGFTLVIFLGLTTPSAFARHILQAPTGPTPLPLLLEKLYSDLGQPHFQSVYKQFNSLGSSEQDDFLLSDLTTSELTQLALDFQELGQALETDPTLLDLYANFEMTLDTSAFNEMDRRLGSLGWWERIKSFLNNKFTKLAKQVSP